MHAPEGDGDGIPCIDDNQLMLRPYALTGGRTRSKYAMDPTSLVRSLRSPPHHLVSPESHLVLNLCMHEPRSIAEVAATLGQPVQVTKILLSDLIDTGHLTVSCAHQNR
jgi:predicted transcriptional regulator